LRRDYFEDYSGSISFILQKNLTVVISLLSISLHQIKRIIIGKKLAIAQYMSVESFDKQAKTTQKKLKLLSKKNTASTKRQFKRRVRIR